MKVKNTKNISIISRQESDESVITRIYKNDTFVFDPEAGESVSERETLIDYRFYFVADLRKVIDNNLRLVRFSVREHQNRSNYSVFSDLENQGPQGVVAALFAKSADIRSEMSTGDAGGLIYRTNIDLLKQFDSFKLRNAKKLSDRELFGTIERSNVINAKKIKKMGKNQQTAQRTITTIDKNFLNSKTFNENYEKSLSLGSDPASMLFPTTNETPADPRKAGTFFRKSIQTGDYSRDATLFSMRNNIIGSPTSTDPTTDKTSVRQFSQGSSVAVVTRYLNRKRLIPVDVTFKKSDLVGINKFLIILDVTDDKGLIFQTVSININHARNVEDFYAPTSGIEAKITFPFDSHRKAARLSLKKNDPNIAGCDIYLREISEAHSLLSSPFRKVKRIMFREGGDKYSESFHYPVHEIFTLPYAESKLSIMRVVPVSKSKKVFGNFTSSVKKNGPFVPFRASIFTTSADNGIILRLESVSSHVAGVCFERRDLTRHEKNFKKVIGRILDDKNDKSFSESGAGAGSLTGKPKSNSFETVDMNCEEDHLYEYRARLYLRGGVTKTSQTSRFQKYIKPIGLISTVVSNISVSPTQAPPLRAEVSGINASVKISFDIDFEIFPTEADKILSGLESAGLAALYEKDITSIKSSLQNIIFFNIERFNISTGETFYLGSFPQGTKVEDDGIKTDALGPIMGQNYTYRVTPCLVSPDIAVQSITLVGTSRSDTKQVIKSTTDIRNPSVFAQLQNLKIHSQSAASQPVGNLLTLDYIKVKATKNYSKSAFQRGTIPTSNLTFGLTDFSTGDNVDINVSTGYSGISIKNINLSLGMRSGPIIRWRSAGGQSARKLVDFFVILAKKQDEKYTAGVCHRLASDNFSFVDFSNKDYVGIVEYSVKPVFLDGKIGDELSIGTILIPDRNFKFKRGN